MKEFHYDNVIWRNDIKMSKKLDKLASKLYFLKTMVNLNLMKGQHF